MFSQSLIQNLHESKKWKKNIQWRFQSNRIYPPTFTWRNLPHFVEIRKENWKNILETTTKNEKNAFFSRVGVEPRLGGLKNIWSLPKKNKAPIPRSMPFVIDPSLPPQRHRLPTWGTMVGSWWDVPSLRTNSEFPPENGWLQYDEFSLWGTIFYPMNCLLGPFCLFSGANCELLVLGSVIGERWTEFNENPLIRSLSQLHGRSAKQLFSTNRLIFAVVVFVGH